jgi:hypothetical protein
MTDIIISAEKRVYRPGDVVRGIVQVDLPHARKIGGVELDAMGLERTEVTVSYGKSSHTYVSQNVIQRFTVLLHGPGMLEAGCHDFPFEFKLPRDILPTFHGQYACITYTIKANLDIPLWFDAHRKVEYYVMPRDDSVCVNMKSVRLGSKDAYDLSKPGFIMDLERATWMSGETITGVLQVTSTGGKRLRKADIKLQSVEWAMAEGVTRDVATDVVQGYISGDALCDGSRVPFGIKVPRVIYSTYKGIYSRLGWALTVNLDIAWGFDTKASQGLIVVNPA